MRVGKVVIPDGLAIWSFRCPGDPEHLNLEESAERFCVAQGSWIKEPSIFRLPEIPPEVNGYYWTSKKGKMALFGRVFTDGTFEDALLGYIRCGLCGEPLDARRRVSGEGEN